MADKINAPPANRKEGTGGRLLSYAARDPATEGRARRSVVVIRFAIMQPG
jgi:hypothetical protein